MTTAAFLVFKAADRSCLMLFQAEDGRFCNAGVEFDLATLRPTYRLIWGSSGASNALAVAEGLGFDPLVIAAARKVRAQNHITVT